MSNDTTLFSSKIELRWVRLVIVRYGFNPLSECAVSNATSEITFVGDSTLMRPRPLGQKNKLKRRNQIRRPDEGGFSRVKSEISINGQKLKICKPKRSRMPLDGSVFTSNCIYSDGKNCNLAAAARGGFLLNIYDQ